MSWSNAMALLDFLTHSSVSSPTLSHTCCPFLSNKFTNMFAYNYLFHINSTFFSRGVNLTLKCTLLSQNKLTTAYKPGLACFLILFSFVCTYVYTFANMICLKLMLWQYSNIYVLNKHWMYACNILLILSRAECKTTITTFIYIWCYNGLALSSQFVVSLFCLKLFTSLNPMVRPYMYCIGSIRLSDSVCLFACTSILRL